jgi:hypothetical protein
MALLAITNASTRLTDLQVSAAIPSLRGRSLWISERIGAWIASWSS